MIEAYLIPALVTAALFGLCLDDPNPNENLIALIFAMLWPLFWAQVFGRLLQALASLILAKISD